MFAVVFGPVDNRLYRFATTLKENFLSEEHEELELTVEGVATEEDIWEVRNSMNMYIYVYNKSLLS